MIEIIVVVTGLALVEIPASGSGDAFVHFPEATGFDSPVLRVEPGPNPPRPLEMDEHTVSFDLGSHQGHAVQADDPPFFRIEIAATSGQTPTKPFDEASRFPSLASYFSRNLSGLREGCRYGDPSPETTCVARDRKGKQVPLLAGQLHLQGDWTLVAGNASKSAREVTLPNGSGAELMRRLVDDKLKSTIDPNWNAVIPDAVVFRTRVANERMVSLASPVGGYVVSQARNPGAAWCKAWNPMQPDCRVIWFENSPECMKPAQVCQPRGAFLQLADTHFAQLYRLLTAYEPGSGLFAGDLYVPFSVPDGKMVSKGDNSPRCYQGFTTY